MSYCRKEGKDEIIFLTKDDYEKQTSENPLLPTDESSVGLIKENGEINWDCPCLQGMADGPCGEPFKEAFSCFHYSEAEPKGVDCLGQFKSMQECFVKYPEIYGGLDDEDEKPEEETNRSATQEEIHQEQASVLDEKPGVVNDNKSFIRTFDDKNIEESIVRLEITDERNDVDNIPQEKAS